MKNFNFSDYNEGFVVSVHLTTKQGDEVKVAAILEQLVAPTMAERGVRLFLPYQSPDAPEMFFIFELYDNEQAWHDHQQTEHFKTIFASLSPCLAKRERVSFVPFVA